MVVRFLSSFMVLGSTLLGGLLPMVPAQAAFTCSVTVVSGASGFYTPPASGNLGVGTLRLSCSRATGDPSTNYFSVSADRGVSGNKNNRVARHAQDATATLTYYLGRDSSCPATASTWAVDNRSTRNNPGVSIVQAQPSMNYTGEASFCVGIPGSTVNPAMPRAGVYTDTVALTVLSCKNATDNNCSADTGGAASLSISITVQPACTISRRPSTVSIAYMAAQTTPATGTTPLGVTCSNGTSYTLTVDAPTAPVAGLNYSIGLMPGLGVYSATAPLSYSAMGTGVEQAGTVSVTIPPRQFGCVGVNCPTTQTHTLTLTQ
jgi:spore coat protein U-like protein